MGSLEKIDLRVPITFSLPTLTSISPISLLYSNYRLRLSWNKIPSIWIGFKVPQKSAVALTTAIAAATTSTTLNTIPSTTHAPSSVVSGARDTTPRARLSLVCAFALSPICTLAFQTTKANMRTKERQANNRPIPQDSVARPRTTSAHLVMGTSGAYSTDCGSYSATCCTS